MEARQLVYRRALLKLSGEVLAGEKGTGIDFDVAEAICARIAECAAMGAQLAVVVGGGNFWRGRSGGAMDKVRADQMGMLATVMNALALADILEQLGARVLVQTAQVMPQIASCVNRKEAVAALEAGQVVIFGGGTGNPFFTTDSTAALRAAEIDAEIVLKATNVDGVYDKDPKKHPDAVKYDTLSHDEILKKKLKVMDATAASLCRDHGIPMLVFNLEGEPENILRALCGEAIGTRVVRDYS
ncbi:MAG: UMP kinase [Oscillospiraceae bacterium]|nr:UMP kinase [Oscillospiraceae bacterium]